MTGDTPKKSSKKNKPDMDLEKNQLDELLEKMKRENKVLKKLIEKILKKNDKPD